MTTPHRENSMTNEQQARGLVENLRLGETCDQYRAARETYLGFIAADALAREIADALIEACNWEIGAPHDHTTPNH